MRSVTPSQDEQEEYRIVAIDVSCDCGAEIHGLLSGDAVDWWIDNHVHPKED